MAPLSNPTATSILQSLAPRKFDKSPQDVKKVGVIVGATVAGAIVLVCILHFLTRRHQKKKRAAQEAQIQSDVEIFSVTTKTGVATNDSQEVRN